jgi:iron complex outermembrane receptor protein
MFYSAYPNEANPHLGPETARTTEVVLDQSLANNLRLSVSGYFYPIRGLISEEGGTAPGLIIYRNQGNINLQGLDLALNKKLPSGLQAGGSFSYQDAKDVSTGSPLTNSPHELAQAHLSVPLFGRKIFASVNGQYVSRRETQVKNYAGGYLLPNFTLFSQKALKGWELSLSMYNFFNKRYADPGAEEHREESIYQDGRTLRLKVSCHF